MKYFPLPIALLSLAMLLNGCAKPVAEKTAPEYAANFAYAGKFFSFHMPIPDDLSVQALDEHSVDFGYTAGHPRYSVYLSFQQQPTKQAEQFFRDMEVRGLHVLSGATLASGVHMRGWASDLVAFPDENTRNCSLTYLYATTFNDTTITINYSVTQEVPLAPKNVWQELCTIYHSEEHQKIMRRLQTILDGFTPGLNFR